MKQKIKSYFENLDPKKLNANSKIKVISISKLGFGASNVNYLVKTNHGKFIFRMNMDPKKKDKSRKEFEALKIIENKNIGPRAYILDESRKMFDSDFIIINYIEGVLCTKIKPYFDESMIKNLAILLAKVHSIRITEKLNKKLPHNSIRLIDELNNFKSYRNYLVKHIHDKYFLNMINESFLKLKKEVEKFKIKSKLVLNQGDFHKGNIIVNNGKYSLIDFEDIEITSQASSLAHLFVDFKHAAFTKQQQEIFIEEYGKHMNLPQNIQEEIQKFVPIKAFLVFLWAVEFTLKIKNKEMHESFLKNSNHKKNVMYAELCFRQALKLKAIDNKYKDFNLKRIT